METAILKQFLALSRSERMTETADLFNISQSALSKNIARLEDELGVKLFDRVGRHIELNHNGAVYAKYVEQSLDSLEHGRKHMRRDKYEIAGHITIVCRSFAPILSDCIARYHAMNPRVEFSLCENDAYAENTDFFLCAYSQDSPFASRSQVWVVEDLFSEKTFLLVAPRCPELGGKPPREISDLRDVPFASMLMTDVFFRDTTVSLCQRAGFTPRIPFRTDEFLVKVEWIKNGLCAGFLPESCIPIAESIAGKLWKLTVEDDPAWVRTVAIMHKKKNQMTEAALDFLAFLLDYYSKPDRQRPICCL